MTRLMTDQDKYYFDTILRRLREFQELLSHKSGATLGSEALADEINWLDCWIEANSRSSSPASVGDADNG